MNRRIAMAFICLLLIALFLYASIAKLSDYSNFKFGLSESPYISQFAGTLAWTVPATELIIVLLLIWSRTRLAGLYAFCILMLAFTIYIAAMLLSASEIPCSCGGVLEEMSWPVHIVFNSVFILLSLAAIILERKRKKSEIIPVHTTNLAYAKGYSSASDPH